MDEQTELLREIRDLLLITAEPAIAKRDEKLRASVREIVGRSKPKEKAIMLMNGSRAQKQIATEVGIDQGALSRCIKALREAGLLTKDQEANPKLVITLPANFFEEAK